MAQPFLEVLARASRGRSSQRRAGGEGLADLPPRAGRAGAGGACRARLAQARAELARASARAGRRCRGGGRRARRARRRRGGRRRRAGSIGWTFAVPVGADAEARRRGEGGVEQLVELRWRAGASRGPRRPRAPPPGRASPCSRTSAPRSMPTIEIVTWLPTPAAAAGLEQPRGCPRPASPRRPSASWRRRRPRSTPSRARSRPSPLVRSTRRCSAPAGTLRALRRQHRDPLAAAEQLGDDERAQRARCRRRPRPPVIARRHPRRCRRRRRHPWPQRRPLRFPPAPAPRESPAGSGPAAPGS